MNLKVDFGKVSRELFKLCVFIRVLIATRPSCDKGNVEGVRRNERELFDYDHHLLACSH